MKRLKLLNEKFRADGFRFALIRKTKSASSVEEQLNEPSTIEKSPSIDFLISTFADEIYILFGSASIISVTSDINFCKHNL